MQKNGIALIFSILLLLFIPLVSQDTSSIVKLKVNKLGSVQLLNSSYVSNPDEIRIGTEVKGTSVNTITVDNIEDEIELVWTNKLTNCNSMFKDMTDITEIDFSEFDSSEVTDMQHMFASCVSLTSINLDNLNTSKVVNMNQMFYNCEVLTSLDVSNFQTSKVTSMTGLFAYCVSLESLDLSKFNTQSNANFNSMFIGDYNLKFLNLSGMTTNAGNNFGHMFYNCSSLKSLDISHFESTNSNKVWVVSAIYMFYNCSSLTSLDLSNFVKTETSNTYIMYYMFMNCENLRYLKFAGKSGSVFDDMFYNTPENMVGCFPQNYQNRDLITLFTNKSCEVLDCSDDWETKQKKINGETGDCMDSCSGDFLYEYNTLCYRKCPKGTKVIETPYLCEETTIEDEEIIYTTNEVIETIELSFEEEEENNEIEANEEEEEEKEENKEENNELEIKEKEKIINSDIITNVNTYENEKETNAVENNEGKANKDSNENNENGDYKELKVALISIGISICVVMIVSALVIIYFIRKYTIRNNFAPVTSLVNPTINPTVNPIVKSNIEKENNEQEEPKEEKIKTVPISIYNVHLQQAPPEVENSQESIEFNIIKDVKN